MPRQGSDKQSRAAREAEEFDRVLAEASQSAPSQASFVPTYTASQQMSVLLLSVACGAIAVYPFLTLYSLYSTLEVAIVALTAIAVALLTHDAATSSIATGMARVLGKYASAAQASSTAASVVYFNLAVTVTLNFTLYAFIAAYAYPNMAQLVPAIASWAVYPLVTAACIPPLILAARGRKLI